jgi:hypothetical protein
MLKLFIAFLTPITLLFTLPLLILRSRAARVHRARVAASLAFIEQLEAALHGNRALVVVSRGGLSFPFLLDPQELEGFTTPRTVLNPDPDRTGVYDA